MVVILKVVVLKGYGDCLTETWLKFQRYIFSYGNVCSMYVVGTSS